MSPAGRIAYLGPPGSFAHQAVVGLARYGEPVAGASVEHVLASVRSGDAAYGLVPFENSVEGAVTATLDSFADVSLPRLQIAAEVVLEVLFVLAVAAGTTLEKVRRVATHPHAEAQCRQWLARVLPDAEVILESSTSAAALATSEGRYDAAICAPIAAQLYGLAAVEEDIADTTRAVTRFVVVARPGKSPAPTGSDRTSVVLFEHGDHPGALLEMLTEFAVRGVNLTRLESRPTGTALGSYCFSIDCDGHVDELRVGETLAALRRVCADVVFLGSYPRADRVAAPQRRGTSNHDFADSANWLAALRRGDPTP